MLSTFIKCFLKWPFEFHTLNFYELTIKKWAPVYWACQCDKLVSCVWESKTWSLQHDDKLYKQQRCETVTFACDKSWHLSSLCYNDSGRFWTEPRFWFVSVPPLVCLSLTWCPACPGGEGKGGAVAAADYIAERSCVFCPLFALEFSSSLNRKVIRAGGVMAGYLKVLNSLSRSAGAAFSRNPAVLAPAANCQTLQQRNCEWKEISGVIRSIIVWTVNCFLTWLCV